MRTSMIPSVIPCMAMVCGLATGCESSSLSSESRSSASGGMGVVSGGAGQPALGGQMSVAGQATEPVGPQGGQSLEAGMPVPAGAQSAGGTLMTAVAGQAIDQAGSLTGGGPMPGGLLAGGTQALAGMNQVGGADGGSTSSGGVDIFGGEIGGRSAPGGEEAIGGRVGPGGQIMGGAAPEPGGQRPENPCADVADATVIKEGPYGVCRYDTACSLAGERVRQVTECRGGRAVEREDVTADGCGRNTEGTVVDQGDFSDCVFADPYMRMGRKVRTQQVCLDGEVTNRDESEVCARPAGVFVSCDMPNGNDVAGVGQLLSPIETIVSAANDEGVELYTHGQRTPNGHLLLDVNSSFFNSPGALRLAGAARDDLPDTSFNKDQVFGYGENWRTVGHGMRWGLEFARAGEAIVTVKMGVSNGISGSQVGIQLGDQISRCQTRPTGGLDDVASLWTLRFDIPAPGVYTLKLDAAEIANGQVGRFQQIDIRGPAAVNGRVLRARWRPAAVHAQWRSSQQVNPGRIWVMELEPDPTMPGYYGPITTPFGYYGSPRNDESRITGVNFSLWSYGQNEDAPPIIEYSHLIAIGDPNAQFGSFSHEGTGAKVRNWNPYEGHTTPTQTLALRLVPGDPYDTFYGYFIDPTTGAWTFFAAGRKYNGGQPNTNLTAGAFVEVAGPPKSNRTGYHPRTVKYRGWYRDTEGEWFTIDRLEYRGSEDFINKSWGVDGHQFWMKMGGIYHRQDVPGNFVKELVNPPAAMERPAYIKGDSVDDLYRLPAEIAVLEPSDVGQNTATARFEATELGTNPVVTFYWGTDEALTFSDRWQNQQRVDEVQVGINTIQLNGLSPATSYRYRVFVRNDEGQTWTLETQSFTTQQ